MVTFVVIAGPQASGKSTLASALGDALRGRGERVAVVALDAIAAMALPTLPSWEAAHEIFETVAGLWARAGTTCVLAEGSGSHEEVARVVRRAPADAVTVTVGVTVSLEAAYERARADPTRGVSKELDFLRAVYERWPAEVGRIAPDVLIDTGQLDVARSVTTLVGEITRRRSGT